MKYMKKAACCITCVLLLVLMLSSVLYPQALAVDNGDTNITPEEVLGRAQYPALKAYFSIAKELKSKDNPERYIEGYGGCYIDSDNQLVICFCDGYQEVQDLLIERCMGRENVNFQKCTFDFNQLLAFASETIAKYNCLIGTIFYIDVPLNHVFFVVDKTIENQLANVELFIQEREFPISFQFQEDHVDECADFFVASPEASNNLIQEGGRSSITLTGGIPLFKRNNDGTYVNYGTLGFSGTYGNKTAYITAGHVLSPITGWYVRSNDLINDEISYSLAITPVSGTNGDYGIVKISSTSYSISKSNQVRISANLSGTVSYYYDVGYELPANTFVYKYGSNTGYTYGQHSLVYTSYPNDFLNVIIGNIHCFAGFTSDHSLCYHGDSGGPVWFMWGDYRTLVGVISGFVTNSCDYACYASMDDFINCGFVPYSLVELTYDDVWD